MTDLTFYKVFANWNIANWRKIEGDYHSNINEIVINEKPCQPRVFLQEKNSEFVSFTNYFKFALDSQIIVAILLPIFF